MKNILLPQELLSYLGSENTDFVVETKRAYPAKLSFFVLLGGVIWTIFTGTLLAPIIVPLFLGQEVFIQVNNVPVVGSVDNLGPIMMPITVSSIFVLIGLGIIFLGIRLFFKKGSCFIGTPTRLVVFRDGNIRSIDWEQFSGEIEIQGDVNKGSLLLQMRTGRMIRRKNDSDRYVPDVIYMIDIQNVFEIEKMCRKRIKENDPTPTNSLG